MTNVDDFLAHYGVAVDDTLTHFGVLGMRWGRRKAQYNSGGTDRHSRNTTAAQEYVDRNGKGKAVAKTVGKSAAVLGLTKYGQSLAGQLSDNNTYVLAGAQLVASAISITTIIRGGHDVLSIIDAKGKKDPKVKK